jgi:hypothetical protein
MCIPYGYHELCALLRLSDWMNMERTQSDWQGGGSMRWLLTIVLSLLFTTSPAHEIPDETECAAIKEKIRHIQSKMRSGYTRTQGERMEAQLRKLRKRRRAKCG